MRPTEHPETLPDGRNGHTKESTMDWIERRDGDFLVSRSGKILGKVTQGSGTTYSAVAVYAAGGNHRAELGDYISNTTARAAVEAHVRDVKLPGAEADATPAR